MSTAPAENRNRDDLGRLLASGGKGATLRRLPGSRGFMISADKYAPWVGVSKRAAKHYRLTCPDLKVIEPKDARRAA